MSSTCCVVAYSTVSVWVCLKKLQTYVGAEALHPVQPVAELGIWSQAGQKCSVAL